MSKRIVFICLAFLGISYSNAKNVNVAKAENLIRNADFAQGFKCWYTHAFPVKKIDGKNVLIIKGKPELGKKNSYLKCATNLSRLTKDAVANKKFTFGVTVKALKVSGKMYFAIREVTDKGKSIYRSIDLKKRDKYNWKKFIKTFTTSPETVKLSVYIVARYLQEDDEIQAKDIFLHYAK